eukprot:gene4985-6206_t
MSSRSHGTRNSSESSGSFARLLSFSKSMERGSFGVLHAMIKDNTFPKFLTIVSVIIEFLQLLSFGFRADFPWGGSIGSTLKRIIAPINHPSNVLNYEGFTILFWIVVGFMILGFINIWYVAFKFYQGRIANIWVIRSLRWYVSFTVAVLYIPILSLFLMGLNCERDGSYGTRLKKFPSADVECFGQKNLPVAIFSILLIIVFSIVAFSSSVTYYEYDTNNKNRFAKPHARFDLSVLILKTIFSFFFELLVGVQWLLVILFFIGSAWLVFGSIIFMPYNSQRLNQIKTGLYSSVFWVSLCTLLTMIISDESSPATTYLAIVGLVPSFVGGFFANRFFYRWLTSKIKYLNNVNNAPPKSIQSQQSQEDKPSGSKVTWGQQPQTLGSKRQLHFPFFSKKTTFAFFVEIMARTLLRHSETPDNIEKVNLLYQCALQYFPKSHLLWMAYTNYLFTVRKDRHVGYAALEKMRRMSPPFDVRFFIYQRDKEREQIMDSDLRGPDHRGKIQDFVSYMEFKKLYNGAKRYHLRCLGYIRRFWRHLLHETIDLKRLSDLSGKIATSENRASEHYERLLALNPNSVRVLRDYSQFLEEVVKDREAAFKLQKKAEAIEDKMSKSLSIEHIKKLDFTVLSSDDEGKDTMGDLEKGGGIQLKEIDKVENSSGSHSKSKDGSDTESSSSSKRGSRYKKFQQSNSINKVSWLMIGTTIISIIFIIVCLIVFRGEMVLHQRSFQGILSLGDGAIEAIHIAKDANTMQEAAIRNIDDPAIENMKGYIQHHLNRLSNIHHALYWGETSPQSYVNEKMWNIKKAGGIQGLYDISEREFTYDEFNKTHPITPLQLQLNELYNTPSFDLQLLVNPTHLDNDSVPASYNKLYSQTYNGWKAVNIYVDNGKLISKIPNEILATKADYNSNFKFIVENGPKNITQAFLKIQQAYVDTLIMETYNTSFIIMYVWLGIFGLLVIIAVTLFRPVVSRLTREKIRTLLLFSFAPKDLILKMVTKKIKMISLDSSSDRDIMFETDDDSDKRQEDSDDEGKGKQNNLHDDTSSIHRGKRSPSQPGTPVNLKRSGFIHTAGGDENDPHLIVNSNRIVGNGSDEGDSRPLMVNSVGGVMDLNKSEGNLHTSIPMKQDGPSDGFGWDGKSKRNVNKKSLKTLMGRLHISYSIALFLLFGFITMGLYVSFNELFRDVASGYDISNSSQRSVNARLVSFFVSELFSPYQDGQDNRKLIQDAINSMQQNHQSLMYLPKVRSLMDGSYGCWMVNKSLCRQPEDPYYSDISQGLDWAVDQYIKHALNLVYVDDTDILPQNPDYNWIKSLAENDIYEGLDLAAFIYFKHWQDIQSKSISISTTILAITAVILLIIYIILFRPFINRLRIQHIHTTALLRLLPEDLQYMEISDKIIDED